MARPEKPVADNRHVVLRFRVTTSEKSAIERSAKEAGLTPSDFLRNLALHARPARTVPTPDREALLKVLAEQNKTGSNLNQIARALNRRQDSAELSGFSMRDLKLAIENVNFLAEYLMEMLGS